MFDAIATQARKKLYPHQAAALDFAIGHLNRSDAACLIRMPTGTGKTGVIACLTRISNPGSSLVLTPWANLRRQMIDDLEKTFWETTGIKPGKPKVTELLPSVAKDVLASKEAQVIVATFTTLNQLRSDDEATYKRLAEVISLVIADEGHYEPAPEWGRSVKKLGLPTLLLTATPYRNDLKLFRITDRERSTFHFTHAKAVEKGVIRKLKCEELVSTADIPSLARTFARYWKAAKSARRLAVATPRAIICCASASDIEMAVRHLKGEGLTAIGLHERFKDSKDPSLMQEVPDPKKEEAEIWVHQHKLTEGLDDHRFCCAVLFTRIPNDRKLIQQVGRVLRRKGDDMGKPAILLAPKQYSAEEEWTAYLEFEPELQLLDPQHFRDVVDKLLDSQPPVEYFDGRFRRRFEPSQIDKKPQVIIPPSVKVRATLRDFSLDEYIEVCTDTLNLEDAVILGPNINGPCQHTPKFALWVYASIRNSRFLQNTSLYEVTLETHCVVLSADYVLISDSRGVLPAEYLQMHTANVKQVKLARFLDERFRPTHVSVDSSIPYDTVLRGADIHGNDLRNIPVSLTDRIQICRSARGASKDAGRRYVGMTGGRLRKEETAEERRTFEPNEFINWADGVAKILDSAVSPSELFHRYMPTCDPPEPLVPRSICVDLLRLKPDLTLSDGRECSLKISSTKISETQARQGEASYSCSFDIETGDDPPYSEPIVFRVAFERVRGRFLFSKEKGPSVQVQMPGDSESKTKSLGEFLTQNQDTLLIGFANGEVVYQGGYFYRIDYSYAEQALIGLISRVDTPNTYGTEKGTEQQIDRAKSRKEKVFPKGSIFRALADGVVPLPFKVDILICDDLGSECADFVAASLSESQISLIHAKAGSGSGISASSFHEIVAQAMKNLTFLTRNAADPQGAGSWSRRHLWNNTGVSRIQRLPAGFPTSRALWRKLKQDILWGSDPRLWVVLATSGCCDRTALQKAVKDVTQRTPETAQLLHLLDGLNAYARQLGVRLLIYDLPFYKKRKSKAA